jgi:hypothetical protein
MRQVVVGLQQAQFKGHAKGALRPLSGLIAMTFLTNDSVSRLPIGLKKFASSSPERITS